MPSIDGVPLDLNVPGCALMLSGAATRTWTETMPGGASVSVSEGSHAVIASGLLTADLDAALPQGRNIINQALDLMSIRSLGSYALADRLDAAFAWAGDGGGRLRSINYVRTQWGFVVDGPLNPPSSAWHPCMRYFRLSQLASDLFDAFRNLYLALESLLDSIRPQRFDQATGRQLEGDWAWFQAALTAAEQKLVASNPGYNLGFFLNPPDKSTGPAAVEAFGADVYRTVRTSVFHAKASRAHALPQHEPDRQVVSDVFARASQFFIYLAEAELGARFLSGGVGTALAQGLGDAVLPNWVIAASSELLSDPDAKGLTGLTRMPTARAPEFDAPYEVAIRGELTTPEQKLSAPVRSVVVVQADDVMNVEPLKVALDLQGVSVWEHVQILRTGAAGLKLDFSS